jgi:RNA polymerase sigma-70 factor, ECF subfamily
VEPNDAELVTRCLDGDADAYADLVRRYQRSVYATAFYYVGRYGGAEDVAQDALLAAYRSLPRLKRPESFGPWLKEITCRTASNWLRRHARKMEHETPLPYKRTLSIEDAREGPRTILELQERVERVQRAIDTLPVRYRLPVVLRYLQELSYDEIGQFTGESRDEVRGILQRAGRQLRQILIEDGKSGEEQTWRRSTK